MDDTAVRLILLIELFAARTGRAVSTISRLATGSGDVVARLRRGADITTRRVDRTLRYLSENWPEDVPWPAHTQRPSGGAPAGATRRGRSTAGGRTAR